jgi:class 3 adenylate cyclase
MAFQGLRVRMAIHMGTSEGGIKGPTCRFVHHLTDLSWGGMILLSEPVANNLAGVLDQLANSAHSLKESVTVPRMVCMGIHTFEDYTEPMEMFHIFNEPLRGRHIKWDDAGLKLRDSNQHSMGFYDAPIKREGVPEPVVIVFADIESMSAIQKASPSDFTDAVLEVHAVMGPLLLKHDGYNILPQREGHFMMAFRNPVQVAHFHADFQAALLKVSWPAKLKELPQTKPQTVDGVLLYGGLTMSLGMSFGVVNKSLTGARAQYTGPTCNRAARVCSMAKAGQLLMFEHEFNEHKAAFAQAVPPVGAKVLFEAVNLKGVQGRPNIVWIDTDPTTRLRIEAKKSRGFRGV